MYFTLLALQLKVWVVLILHSTHHTTPPERLGERVVINAVFRDAMTQNGMIQYGDSQVGTDSGRWSMHEPDSS